MNTGWKKWLREVGMMFLRRTAVWGGPYIGRMCRLTPEAGRDTPGIPRSGFRLREWVLHLNGVTSLALCPLEPLTNQFHGRLGPTSLVLETQFQGELNDTRAGAERQDT
jgi:hypothetical protein